jgi:hypothetical protein
VDWNWLQSIVVDAKLIALADAVPADRATAANTNELAKRANMTNLDL